MTLEEVIADLKAKAAEWQSGYDRSPKTANDSGLKWAADALLERATFYEQAAGK
jgi:hypothetical protein